MERFVEQLGEKRCAPLELLSCDMASWITLPVPRGLPNAEICLDPFHVVKLPTDALDLVRREVWNDVRRQHANKRLYRAYLPKQQLRQI
jgi:transposase